MDQAILWEQWAEGLVGSGGIIPEKVAIIRNLFHTATVEKS